MTSPPTKEQKIQEAGAAYILSHFGEGDSRAYEEDRIHHFEAGYKAALSSQAERERQIAREAWEAGWQEGECDHRRLCTDAPALEFEDYWKSRGSK